MPNLTSDQRVSLGLGYELSISDRVDLAVQSMFSRYVFDRESYYDRINEDLPPFSLNHDESDGRWWNLNAKLSVEYERHHLLAGMEYQNNARQHLRKYDEQPFEIYLDQNRNSDTWAVYLQDEFRFTDRLLINAGLRIDRYSNFGSSLNPRFAAIYSPNQTTSMKLIYGTAFRAPSEYELQPGVDRIASPSLEPEEIKTVELVLEHYFLPNTRLIVAAHHNELTRLIELVDDEEADQLVYRNSGRARSVGFEVEAEHRWQSGERLRLSYTWQRAIDDATERDLPVSPRHLIKLNYSKAFFDNALQAGLELQYTSAQRTLLYGTEDELDPSYMFRPVDAQTKVNVNLVSKRFNNGLQFRAGVYDLFDQVKYHPAGKEHDHNAIPQSGRSFRMEVNYLLNR
jgi:outer membrane receptor for ferrienterochelin and colicins